MKKEEDITIEKARELVANKLVWPRARDFLYDFVPEIHPSWLEGLKVEGLKDEPRAKRYILESLGVKPSFHDFPKEDSSRISLLDSATLESIAMWLGALACASELRKITNGAAVRKLKASLPGVYPQVFDWTMYAKFEKLKLEGPAPEDPGDILPIGWAIVASLVDTFPEAVKKRFWMKLPRSVSSNLPARGKKGPFALESSDIISIIQLLMKLQFPEAYKICCS